MRSICKGLGESKHSNFFSRAIPTFIMALEVMALPNKLSITIVILVYLKPQPKSSYKSRIAPIIQHFMVTTKLVGEKSQLRAPIKGIHFLPQLSFPSFLVQHGLKYNHS